MIFVFLGIGCKTKSPSTDETTELIVESDTTVVLTNAGIVEEERTSEKCNCNDSKLKNVEHVRFDGDSPDRNDSILSVYSTDSLRLSVKSIDFFGFDTIPDKFAVFKNVEYIGIGGNTQGLDLFPNLKSVSFWGGYLNVNSSDKWLDKIEKIRVEKGVVKGLNTFKSTPNLKEIYLAFSSFEPFPSDFDQLKCLRSITLGAYRGNVDLSKIDLSLNPCLEKAVFNTWYNAFSGIPKGLDTNKTFHLVVEHQKLTKEEKETVKEFNNRRKQK